MLRFARDFWLYRVRLWNELCVKTLKVMGLKLSPHDKCVFNKEINGKQYTVVWQVGDNDLSHVDPKVVTEIIEVIKRHFGDLVIIRGNEHELLDMKAIMERKNKKIIIDMREQIEEAFEMFGEGLDGTVASASNKNIFTSHDGE